MIIHNRIKCLKCGDVIESKSVHDFRWCSCHACAVDGGRQYLRRLGEPTDWEDMSECIEDPPDPPDQDEYAVTTEQLKEQYKEELEDYIEKVIKDSIKQKYKYKRDKW